MIKNVARMIFCVFLSCGSLSGAMLYLINIAPLTPVLISCSYVSE